MPARSDPASFVGRRDERDALRRWLAEAMQGSPRVVVAAGEAGMGKTALLRWLLDEARRAGAHTAWASGVEGVAVPFLAGEQLLSNLPRRPSANGLAGGGDGDGEGQASANLVRAVQRVLDAGSIGPVVLVLDDLQWADEATAAMVQHLAVQSGTAGQRLPLMLVCATRTADAADATTPGLSAGRRLLREQHARSLFVGPMHEVDVRELMHALTGSFPTSAVLREVVDATGGSPLLVRARVLAAQRGEQLPEQFVAANLLEGRLADLPGPARRAAEIVAALGARVPLAALPVALAAVGDGVDGPAAATALDPAIATGLLVIDGDDVQFEHSLYRRAVLQSMDADRRRRLTRRIAAAVVTEPLRSLLPVSVVAAHLREAADIGTGDGAAVVPADVAAAIRWAAGDEAFAASAWGLAAEHYVAVLEPSPGQETSGTSGDALPELPERGEAWRWLRAGDAMFRDNDVRCAELLRRAVALAEAGDDVEVLAPAAVLLVRGLLTLGTGIAAMSSEEGLALDLAARADSRVDPWRAALFGVSAECRFGALDFERGAELAAAARAAAEGTFDPLSVWAVELGEGLQHLAGLRLSAAVAGFGHAETAAADAGSDWHIASSRLRTSMVELMRGDVVTAAVHAAAGLDVARRCHHWSECSMGGAILTEAMALRGDPAVESEAEAAAAMHRRSAYVFSPTVLFPALAYARFTRSDLGGAIDALADLEHAGMRAASSERTLTIQRIRVGLAGVDSLGFEPRPPRRMPDLYTLDPLANAAEASMLVGDRSVMEACAAMVAELLSADVSVAMGWPHFFWRIATELSVALGRSDARELLARARHLAARSGMVFESVQLDLLASRLADTVAESADHAAAALRSADAAGLMVGVVAATERLQQLGASFERPLDRVVLSTDIVASTDLTRRLGDAGWVELIDEHDRLVRSVVRRFGGVVFRHTGDGMCAWFTSAAHAVDATSTLLAEFEGRLFQQGRTRMQIRAGLALGVPVTRADGEVFGVTVVEAVRLCAMARPNTGLASVAVASVAGRPLAPSGSHLLKGFDSPTETCEVLPSA